MQRFALNVVATGWDEPPLDGAKASDDVAAMLRMVTPDDGKEHLVAVALNARGKVEGYEVIASGTVDTCMMYPRDIFAWALKVPMTRYVAIAHNHPSGEVELSPQDRVGSAVVQRCGALLGLDLAWSMVFTHRSEAWQVWTPESGAKRRSQPRPGEEEDAPPQRPEMSPEEEEPEPEETGIEPEEEEGETGGEEAPPANVVLPQGDVGLDEVRAAMRRVIGRR